MRTVVGPMLIGLLSMPVAGCGGEDGGRGLSATSRTAAAGLDLASAQIIVRTACDQAAVVRSLQGQVNYYEAAWGEASVLWPDQSLHAAPAKWARIQKMNPRVSTTTCGIYNY
jgi:hypothetical protein